MKKTLWMIVILAGILVILALVFRGPVSDHAVEWNGDRIDVPDTDETQENLSAQAGEPALGESTFRTLPAE